MLNLVLLFDAKKKKTLLLIETQALVSVATVFELRCNCEAADAHMLAMFSALWSAATYLWSFSSVSPTYVYVLMWPKRRVIVISWKNEKHYSCGWNRLGLILYELGCMILLIKKLSDPITTSNRLLCCHMYVNNLFSSIYSSFFLFFWVKILSSTYSHDLSREQIYNYQDRNSVTLFEGNLC